MSTHPIVPGLSLTNRMLLYTSSLLAPAQFMSGMGNHCPSNIGFLAYNWYTQITWYKAAQADRLHAFSMCMSHFNLIYAFTYLGGISSGNMVMGTLQGLLTAGVLILNTATAWISWKTNQPPGFGEYHFFFFGWRTLSEGWHKFMLVWQIFDTITAFILAIAAVVASYSVPEATDDDNRGPWTKWGTTLAMIPFGAAIAIIFIWPEILWTELLIARNDIDSATDWVAVWLFIAQVGTMIIPPFCSS